MLENPVDFFSRQSSRVVRPSPEYSPPAAVVERDGDQIPVLLGLDEAEGLAGYDPGGNRMLRLEPEDVIGVVNVRPAAVFWGTDLSWSEEALLVANPATVLPFSRRAALGKKFPALPPGMVSGYPMARRSMEKFREEVASPTSFRLAAIFSAFSIQAPISETEKAYDCFADVYLKNRRFLPWQELQDCVARLGLPQARGSMYNELAVYSRVVHAYAKQGLRDRELRRKLVLGTKLPRGLGIAKLSFTLALCGHDTICLDARLLQAMFGDKRRQVEGLISRKNTRGYYTEEALSRYEAVEDAFLRGNPYYEPKDPLGRARAQWMSWEAAPVKGGVPTPTSHPTWLRLAEASARR